MMPTAVLYDTIRTWIDAHAGRVPTIKEYRSDPTLPCPSKVYRRLGSLPEVYASLEAQGVESCLRHYRTVLARRRAQHARRAGLASWAARMAHWRRLTPPEAQAIVARYAQGGISQRALGAQYGVSQTTVQNLISAALAEHFAQQGAPRHHQEAHDE